MLAFKRIAIVNRGEPAMRLIVAVRELNREREQQLRTIALFTEPDRRSMFVREADEAYDLGPATFVDPRDGERKNSYLDYQRLERALVDSGAEAVWVGWGFVAEHAEFAELCERLGVVFIGPRSAVMRELGDKIASKRIAEAAGVEVVPWSGGPVEDLEQARELAARLGYPLVIKATAGGGGRGIRRVHAASELGDAFEKARSEALKAFGDATVFIERMVERARHVEVQLIGDDQGRVWAPGVRDCTIQRRNQKVLEEAPSPVLSVEQDRELREAAIRLAQAAGYTGAGTVEFLYDQEEKRFFFMEVNARLQVEHPVTELTTGLDLVKLQLHVAAGGHLEGDPPASQGHAIEVRLNAEDPENAFAPAPGTIERLRLATGPGIRVDTGVDEGDVVPPEFDSMIAKLMAHGRSREEALARLRRAVAESTVVLRGGATNKGFLLELLGREEVCQSRYHVGWLDRLVVEGRHLNRQHAEVAVLRAAIEAYEAEVGVEKARFYASAARGRPEVSSEIGKSVELTYQGNPYKLHVSRLGPQRYRVRVNGDRLDVSVEELGRGEQRLSCGGRRFRLMCVPQGLGYLVEVNGVPHLVSRDRGGIVRAPSPAVVVSVVVKEGDEVAVGDRLAVLEAMKTEMAITAKFAGRVRQVMVIDNVQVGPGTPLMLIEPPSDEQITVDQQRVDFSQLRPPSQVEQTACERQMDEFRCLVLGFDADAGELARVIGEIGELTHGLGVDDPALLRWEDEVLSIFVDQLALFRRYPSDALEASRTSTKEYLFSYLRDLGARGQGLPATFVESLQSALAHYDVSTLDPTPELEEALFRICKAQKRIEEQLAPVLSVLQRRLEHVETLLSVVESGFHQVLEGLIAQTQRRYQTINDVAREVYYRYYHQPILEQVRSRAYAEAGENLARLAQATEPSERSGVIDALVNCPQPLRRFFSRQAEGAEPAIRRAMLEVLTRRYYRIRQLRDFRFIEREGEVFATTEYNHDGKTIHVVAAHVEQAGLPQLARALAPLVEDYPREHDVVLDLYAWQSMALGDLESLQRDALALINDLGLERPIRRIVLALIGRQAAGDGRGNGGRGNGAGGNGSGRQVEFFTFRRRPDGSYYEETLYRNIHPMMAKRLHLWRLANFSIERIPIGAEDVFLFRGVGRENPKDVRLFALAEVRDLTPVRDERGRVIGLPDLERQLLESLTAIRRYQAHQAPHDRLHWNRIQLFVWPPLILRPEEQSELIHKLAPATEGLGMERVLVRGRIPDPRSGELRDQMVDISRTGWGLAARLREVPTQPMKPLSAYEQKVVQLRQRGLIYPYELIKMVTPAREGVQADFPAGEFVEYDLDAQGELAPASRPYGENTANIVVGLITNFTPKYPEGLTRVVLFGDPSRSMGSLAEPECRRIMAALDLARERQIPVEWVALSAGAKISMDSGVENMDWIAAVLRALVDFTQAGHEVNIIVNGINVGAQPYWNAEATMLMHTRGVLIQTAEGAMVLTGKRALDYSGGVSADDNLGIGGYDRIMGLNGQAQFFAKDVSEAYQILLRYYEHTYVFPGERFPRRATTSDPFDRDVRAYTHGRSDGAGFALVGDVLSNERNPGRKKPFDIRRVMRAAIDEDHPPLERWFGMRGAEVGVVWDAHLGGCPICLLGLESRPLPRMGFVPADGPEQWTAGTLFPLSSKKIARAINAASGNRPVVVLANLSGFDGSPESMRNLQLEYGAEIGRAVVNFKGPFVFLVVSRYHGGAFVVFSNRLNDNMEVAALEGTHASVIGGAPAAAVVFAREVHKRALRDSRVKELEQQLERATGAERVRLRARHAAVFKNVHSEKLGQVADEFDAVHSIYRAQKVGSVHKIIPPDRMRPYLIDAVERGIQRELQRVGKSR